MQIYFLLTESCNLNCSMCIRGRQQGASMDIGALVRVLEENDLAAHDLVVTGGEPSLHGNYTEIVHMMAAKAHTVSVTSNGTLDLRLEELVGLDNLNFQISLDGDRTAHNGIRGENAFERTWTTLEKLDAMGMKYSVASVASRKNQEGILRLLPELKALKNMRHLSVSYEMPFGSAAGLEGIMTAEEWNSFVDSLIAKAEFRLKVKKIFAFELYDRNKAGFEGKRIINCGSGIDKIYVYPDFKVYPCTCLTDFLVGDLANQSLSEILDGEPMKVFTRYKLDAGSACQGCRYKSLCNGGCIGMSYHYLGKLGMGDMRCPKLFKEK